MKGEPPALIQVGLSKQDHGEWKVLVACVFLNCTPRKTAEPILNQFFEKWPSPASFICANDEEVKLLIKPLGFVNRRSDRLKKLTKAFMQRNWTDARDLPGIGEYGGRCHDMFFRGIIGNDPPKDHALVQYWHWAIS